MNDCLFCKIIKGDVPSRTIYEDNILKVFMNINPTTNGHLLIVPKKHQVTFDDVSEEFITHSLDIIKNTLYPLLKEKLNCIGLTISQNNYYGQEVKHFHIHVTPRYENDLLDYHYNKEMLNDLDHIYNLLTEKN